MCVQEEEEKRKKTEDAEMSGWTNSTNQDAAVLSELKSLSEDNPLTSEKVEDLAECPQKPHQLPPLKPLSASELNALSADLVRTEN